MEMVLKIVMVMVMVSNLLAKLRLSFLDGGHNDVTEKVAAGTNRHHHHHHILDASERLCILKSQHSCWLQLTNL